MTDQSPNPIEPGNLDIIHDEGRRDPQEGDMKDESGRPFLRVFFACANQYVRVYRDQTVTSYLARCPKCGESKRFMVAAGGTEQRFFTLSCK